MITSSFSNHNFCSSTKIFYLRLRCSVPVTCFFLFTVFLLCGCAKEPELPKGRVRIAVAKEMLASLAMIADVEGFFAQNGIDAEVKYYDSGKLALDAMLSGGADVATTAETPFVLSSFERNDFSIISSMGSSDNDCVIIARRDRGIQNVKDLEGKHIAITKGTAIHYFFSLFIMKHGISEKDLTLSFMLPGRLPEALGRAEIDAFVMREPYISQAKEKLGDNDVIFAEPGMYKKIFVLVALNRFMNEKPEAVKKLLKSMIMAETFLRKNKDRAVDITSNTSGTKKEKVLVLWTDLHLGLSLDHQLLMALEHEANWAVGSELTDAKQSPDYLMLINSNALEDVKPEAVTLIR